MALYVAIVILALLVGFGGGDDWRDEVALIWGTAIGLTIAHLFAYELTSIMAAGGKPEPEDYWGALGIGAAAVGIALLATIPYWTLRDTGDASAAASVLLMAVIGIAGFFTARHAGATKMRSLLYTIVVLVLAAVVVAIKFTLTH